MSTAARRKITKQEDKHMKISKHIHFYLALTLYYLYLLTSQAYARPWYYPNDITADIVNPYLTPARIADSKPSWHNQLVLWEGIIDDHTLDTSGLQSLRLKCNSQSIPVRFIRKVRNLEVSRKGYHAAIKGRVVLHDNKFSHLQGLSVILISPAKDHSFASWAETSANDLANYLSWRAAFHKNGISKEQALTIGRTLLNTAHSQKIDPLLFASLIQIESAYDPKAVSVSGAMGLGQLMPFTARDYKISDPFDPIQNLKGSGKMLGSLTREWSFKSNRDALVLASYNAGPNCVKRLKGQIPPYAETINYIYFIGFLRSSTKSQIDALGIIN